MVQVNFPFPFLVGESGRLTDVGAMAQAPLCSVPLLLPGRVGSFLTCAGLILPGGRLAGF